MPLLNYQTKIWTKITQDKNQEPDGQKNEGIANADNKNLSGQLFCLDNFFVQIIFLSRQFFCPDNFFVQTTFLSGQFFCQDNFFVRTIFLSGQKGIYHQVEFRPLEEEGGGWEGGLALDWGKFQLINAQTLLPAPT